MKLSCPENQTNNSNSSQIAKLFLLLQIQALAPGKSLRNKSLSYPGLNKKQRFVRARARRGGGQVLNKINFLGQQIQN